MTIAADKKHAQVLMKKMDYAKAEKHAAKCGFPSLSSWANAVLLREMKKPVHIKP
jgi:hypothetical protein